MSNHLGQANGKRVVIIGGTSGIGLATAELLLARGARVLVTGRTAAKQAAARAALSDAAIVVESDATSLPAIDALVERVRAELGAIDVLFVNAGVSRWSPFEATPEAVYDELLAVNVKGPYFTIQKLAPLLAPGSAIVLTTSVVNVVGLPMLSAYAASKAALRSLTRTLARELLPRGIRVNAVSPGPIDTSPLEDSPTKRQLREAIPMQRLGRPEEVAAAVAFLAFDATFTTGAELAIDGGGTQI
ncbi:3-oxoacyl-[acyl-carrier protein] reductase [Minicystis rosea]|nr:3-oxoacyl-[acyl-carrier protein] reductase [Minicystis rosea]